MGHIELDYLWIPWGEGFFSLLSHNPNWSQPLHNTFFDNLNAFRWGCKRVIWLIFGVQLIYPIFSFIIIIQALSQLCWGRLHKLCFSVSIYFGLNPLVNCICRSIFTTFLFLPIPCPWLVAYCPLWGPFIYIAMVAVFPCGPNWMRAFFLLLFR